ncbi:MAG: SLC13 family permease [bacterium]|nr:SLC13 family permease [bacterium]
MTTTFVILGVTIVLFVWGRWSPDLVALLSLLALALSGVIDTNDALSGFGNPTVVMIAALFVVGEGLSQTGVTGWGGKRLLEAARGSKLRLLVVVMAGTAGLSAFISNTGTVATLLPAVVAAAWTVGSVPSKFLMPLAFAANTGGLLTLTGTPPNIVVAQTLEQSGLRPFSFFEFALIGGPLLVAAVAYMALVGRRVLPDRSADQRPVDVAADLADLAAAYSLGENQFRLRVRSKSTLIGKTATEAALGPNYGAPLLRIEGREIAPDVVLQHDDILVVRAPSETIDRLMHELGLGLEPPTDDPGEFVSKEIGLAEVIPTPRSEYLGRPMAVGQISERFPVHVLAVRRRGKPVVDGKEMTLEFGDSLLVRGTWEAIGELQSERRNFVVVGTPEAMATEVTGLRPRAGVAVAALAGMVVLMVSGIVSTVIAALIAAAAMVLGGCVSAREAYRSISWSSVVLIAAMIPMGVALETTGGARVVAEGLVNTLGDLSPVALMAGVFLLTTGFSQVINNTATAVLVAPIVMQAAVSLGVSPHPLLMIVAVSASTAFLTPIGTTTNILVFSPGGYQFTDYLKVGLPLMLIFLAVSLVLVPLIWPL